MQRRAVPFVILGLTLIAAVALLERGKPSRAQSESQTASSTPPATATSTTTVGTYTAFCGLWRVDEGFVSTIHLKNSLIIGPLEVTPVLYMADGTEYALPAVKIATAGVASVNVNLALGEAPPEMASHLSRFGSAALRYQYAWPAVLTADMAMLNVADSLIFTSPFNEYHEQVSATRTLEGLWWKHDPEVGGFVSLANTTSGDLSVSFEIIGSAGSALPAQALTLPGHASRRLDLDDLIAGLPGLETQQGGLRIRYNGRAGDLMVVGGLENRREGYSADMPFAAHDLSSGDAAPMTYANLGLRVGAPDPAAGFPGGTRFLPYAAVRNTTEKPLTVSSTLNYMAGGKPVSVSLGQLQLKPFESRQLDFKALLTALGLGSFKGDVNVALSFTGHAGDLVFATGSADQTGTYVFGVLPEGVSQSRGKESPFWTVANGFDTRLALWNPTDQAQDLLVSLYYGDGSGKYKLPVHLDGQASALIDLAQLIAAQLPDAESHVIPPTVQSGSVVVSSAKGEAQPITVALSNAIFNVATATCQSDCFSCNGYSGPRILDQAIS